MFNTSWRYSIGVLIMRCLDKIESGNPLIQTGLYLPGNYSTHRALAGLEVVLCRITPQI